jgi:hypothetical protein
MPSVTILVISNRNRLVWFSDFFSKFGFLKIETKIVSTKRKIGPPVNRQICFVFRLNLRCAAMTVGSRISTRGG